LFKGDNRLLLDMQQIRFDDLEEKIRDEIKTAEESADWAFPRGRDVKIGAVLVAENGKRYTGANIARERFNNSTCAERMAVDKALNDGVAKIERIVVIGVNDSKPFEEVVAPCGACRQIIFDALKELRQEDTELILVNSNKSKIVRANLSELLPFAYESSR
jgi:cytidine deaminase